MALTIFFLLISTLSSNSLFAQKNYIPGLIIENNNDTISGLINYQNWAKNPKSIEFKTSENSQTTIRSPSSIKAFHISKDIYISKITSIDKSPYKTSKLVPKDDVNNFLVTDTVFLEVLIRGEADLYSLLDENAKNHYFIRYKDFDGELLYKRFLTDGNAYTLRKYRNQLSYIFLDCPSSSEAIQKAEYKKRDLIKIVSHYNNCISAGNSYTKIPEKITLETAIIAGVSATALSFESADHFSYLTNSDFGYSAKPTIGLSLNISLPRNRRKWSLYNELIYTQYAVSASSTIKDFSLYTDYHINFDISYLKLSNLIRYSFAPGAKIKPFINLGMMNGIAINTYNSKDYESYILLNDEKYITSSAVGEKAINDFRKYEQGLVAGLGANYKKFSCELRYEATNGFSEYVTLSSKTKIFYLIVGYCF